MNFLRYAISSTHPIFNPCRSSIVLIKIEASINESYVPVGFAHGFYVMEDETEIVYYCAHNEYSAEHERGIIWNDADINIQWPAQNPILSAKDQQAGALKDL